MLLTPSANLPPLQPPALEQASGYRLEDLRSCAHEMHSIHQRAYAQNGGGGGGAGSPQQGQGQQGQQGQSTLHAVRTKYSSEKYQRVAYYVPHQRL